jgi:signal transduction histidine kinase
MKKQITLLCLLFFCVPSSSAQNNAAEINQLLEDAYDSIYVNPEWASRSIKAGLKRAEILQEMELVSNANNYLGILERNQKNYAAALAHFQKAKDIRHNLGLELREANAKVNIGSVYREMEDYSKSLEQLFEAVEVYLTHNNRAGLVGTYLEMANTFQNEGSLSKSTVSAQKALEIAKSLSDLKFEGLANYQLGLNYLYDGKLDSASIHCQVAMTLFTQLNNPIKLIRSQGLWANILELQGKYEKSEEVYKQIFMELGQNLEKDSSFAFSVYLNYATLMNKIGNANLALEYLYKAEMEVGDLPITVDDQIILATNKAEAYSNLKQADSTCYFLELGMALKDSLYSMNRFNAISRAEVKFKTRDVTTKLNTVRIDFEKVKAQKAKLEGFLMCVPFLVIGLIIYFIQRIQKAKIIARHKEELHLRRIGELIQSSDLRTRVAYFEGKESEKTRIAMQMHDSIGNSLMALKIRLDILERATQDRARENQSIHKSLQILEEAYEDVRNLSHELKRNGSINLIASLRSLAELAEGTERLGFNVIDNSIDNTLIGENSKEEIIKIVKELLGNTMRYANATDVVVDVKMLDDQLSVHYSDNGMVKRFYNPEQAGIGIENIYNRAKAMHGEFLPIMIEGRPFSATLTIPINLN